ncbi:MAG: hypothetical protein QOK38_2341 [Acidobacteriaceae bacterium]|jgi:hypothetical protein|nr:hypothetical protein [Acidobacteriaceae bacterium]
MRVALQRGVDLNTERDESGGARLAGRRAVEGLGGTGARVLRQNAGCNDCAGRGVGGHVSACRGKRCDCLRRLRSAANGGAARVAAGGGADAGLLGDCLGDYGVHLRGSGQAPDAADCAGRRREHQQEDQGDGELCAARHWLQCNLLWTGLDRQSPALVRVGRPYLRSRGVWWYPMFQHRNVLTQRHAVPGILTRDRGYPRCSVRQAAVAVQ